MQSLLDQYDPFHIPPRTQLLQKHIQAAKLGKRHSIIQRCLCCNLVINKAEIPFCSSDLSLSFLGPAYPFYFTLNKYFSCILFIQFIFSGSFLMFFHTLKCQVDCIKILGIPVISFEQINQGLKSNQIPNLLTCLILLLTVLLIKPRIQHQLQQFKNQYPSPAHYTILLQRLPQTSKQQIKQFFKILQYEPIIVQLAYDISEYEQFIKKKISKLQEIAEKSNRQIQDSSIQQLKQQVGMIDKKIQQIQNSQPIFLGTAFVTFQKQQTATKLINQYGPTFLRSIKNLMPIQSPYLKYKNKQILLSRCPAPSQTLWENLGFSFTRNLGFHIITIICVIIMLEGQFRFQTLLLEKALGYKRQIIDQNQKDYYLILKAFGMALSIVLINYLIRLVILLFSYLQKYPSFSKQTNFFTNTYLLTFMINSSMAIYIVHTNQEGQAQTKLLLYDITLVVIVNSYSQILYKCFDPLIWGKYLYKLYISKYKFNMITQKTAHQIYQPPPFSIGDNFQYIGRTLFLTTWFATISPFGIASGILALGINYLVDKFLLLKICKSPPSYRPSQTLIYSLPFLPLIYLLGAIQYEARIADSNDILQLGVQFIHYGITSIGVLFVVIGYSIVYKPQNNHKRPNYTQQSKHFRTDYQISNPANNIFKTLTQYKCLYQ